MQDKISRAFDISGPPREKDLAKIYTENEGHITTLMLRNIPVKYTQDLLLSELNDCLGHNNTFDFFYLPWDQQNDCNTGYAFVNFCTPTAAERCIRIFTNFKFRWLNSSRTCTVFPAHIQGLENNILHLMDRAISEARAHYPIIMWKGKKMKLGKVIAALEERQQPLKGPISTPGCFAGKRQPMGSTSQEGSAGMQPTPELDMLGAMPSLLKALQRKRKARSTRFTTFCDGGSVPSARSCFFESTESTSTPVPSITFEGEDAPHPCSDPQSAGPSASPPLPASAGLLMPCAAPQFEAVPPSPSQADVHTIKLPDPTQDVLSKFLMRYGI